MSSSLKNVWPQLLLRCALAVGAGVWVGVLRSVLLLVGYVHLPFPWKNLVLLMPVVVAIVFFLVRSAVGVFDLLLFMGVATVLIATSLPTVFIFRHMDSRCLGGDGFSCHGAAVVQDRYLGSFLGRLWAPRDRVEELLDRACGLGCRAGCQRVLIVHNHSGSQ